MLRPLGVMQGRLLPQYKGRYQAHPLGYWQDEFNLAANLDLDCIEFILDCSDVAHNPLLTQEGREQIKSLSDQTGVSVISVCADYLMDAPLHAEDDQEVEKSMFILRQLLDASVELGIQDIVIPCVDQSSMQNKRLRDRFQEVLPEIIPKAEQSNVNLSLETDLSPLLIAELLNRLHSSQVTINYDIGNSASLGYDPIEELKAYGERISDIHIKDRTLGGKSVKLGTGHADIPGFITLIERYDYRGPFIMQAYRDVDGISIFKEQLYWINQYLGGSNCQ
jgi:L-ribulose-5-phosphate 3-epimerase